MRVLIVADFHFKYSIWHSIGLRTHGAEVAILAREHTGEVGGHRGERERLIADARAAGVGYIPVPYPVAPPSTYPAVLRALRAVRAFKPDVVHAHDNSDPRLFLATRGYPTVFVVHDPQPHPGQPRLRVRRAVFRRAWARSADRFLVHGARLRDALAASVDRDRIVVIPHGALVAEEPLPPPTDPAVLLVGRLEPYKGLEVLVDAMRGVWERRPEIRLIVAGEGPGAASVPSHPRIDHVRGYVPEAEMEQLFRRASLVALPYTEASQSGIGLRAIGQGIPVVVSSLGALPELVIDRSFCVPPADRDALAAAILRHVEHGPDLRTSFLRYARERFSWEAVARETLDFYARWLPAASQESAPSFV